MLCDRKKEHEEGDDEPRKKKREQKSMSDIKDDPNKMKYNNIKSIDHNHNEELHVGTPGSVGSMLKWEANQNVKVCQVLSNVQEML